MKYSLLQLFFLILSVTILYYFSTLSYFTPLTKDGNINWYNFTIVLLLVFLLMQALVSLLVYWGQKLIAFGWKEFPPKALSIKWGLGVGLTSVVLLLLNVFHLLSLEWGIVISLILFIGFLFLF